MDTKTLLKPFNGLSPAKIAEMTKSAGRPITARTVRNVRDGKNWPSRRTTEALEAAAKPRAT